MTQVTQKGQVSIWRIIIAVCTAGISLLFIGWRKPLGRSKVVVTKTDGQ